MNDSDISHSVFSDESYYGSSRYRSIALVSLERIHVDSIVSELNKLLSESGMSEYLGVVLQAQADGPVTAGSNLSFYSSSMNEEYTLDQSANADTASYIDIVFTHVFQGLNYLVGGFSQSQHNA